MNFLLNVIRIFFKNKWKEIKNLTRTAQWITLLEALIIIGIIIVVCLIVTGICYGFGYIIVEILGWITLIGDTTYAQIGAVALISVFVVVGLLYAGYKFIGWVWSNIKIAIAEAKEI